MPICSYLTCETESYSSCGCWECSKSLWLDGAFFSITSSPSFENSIWHLSNSWRKCFYLRWRRLRYTLSGVTKRTSTSTWEWKFRLRRYCLTKDSNFNKLWGAKKSAAGDHSARRFKRNWDECKRYFKHVWDQRVQETKSIRDRRY